jgi:two-component system, LytTR family, sensor histidine kinase AlgZ
MQDTRILSTFQEEPPEAPEPATVRTLVFDACSVGVALRAVLFVDWLARLSLLTGGALPATVVWLVVACACKRGLARLPLKAQYVVGVLLGALAGLYGGGMLFIAGLLVPAPWVACAFSGALLSAVLVAALALRARGQMPAATTARLQELQSRIRPHFLFNLFRRALADPGESVLLGQEITLAQRYLAIEQVRFGERLRVVWSLDPRAESARLPPLLLQPLVENAVHHGVEPSAEGAEIKISSERRGSTVVVKVTNTVPAGPGAPGNGVALENVRTRLRLLHDVQGQFQSIFKNGVFQVRIEVPL